MSATAIAATVESLRGKPWNSTEVPDEVLKAHGMLGEEERRCLFHLAKEHYSGRGEVVDAGAFIGASASSLAAGMAASGRVEGSGKHLFSYDYFAAIDEYVADFISESVRPIERGESYLDVFEGQTAPWSDLIEAIPGDFCEAEWIGSPIELLFIDIAKTRKLHSHVVRSFFGHLIPGHSVVIHQDYQHAWHPYIHISMEFLGDHFELIDPLVEHQSRVWIYKEEIPEDRLARVVDYDFTVEERAELLEDLVARESGPSRDMLRVVQYWSAWTGKDLERAERYRAELDADREQGPEDAIWWNQFDRMKDFVDKKSQ